MRSTRLGPVLLSVALAASLSACDLFPQAMIHQSEGVDERFQALSRRALPLLDQTALAAGYTFIVGSDVHFRSGREGPRPAALQAFAWAARSANASFVLFAGDLTYAGLADEYSSMLAFTQTLTDSAAAMLPWISAVGNHDLFNDGFTEYLAAIGPSYALVPAGPVSIYVLDDASSTVGTLQFARLSSDMGADPKPKIVLAHVPILGSRSGASVRIPDTRERAALLDLFVRSGVRLVLVGHTHVRDQASFGPLTEITLGSLTDGPDGLAHWLVVRVDASGAVSFEASDF